MFQNVITNVETNDRVTALTFDDGPHPVYTPSLLHILKKHKAKATFFLVGEQAVKYPDIVEQIATAGHEIGTHTWKHRNLTLIKSRRHRMKLMWKGSKAIAPYFTRLFRPPYGAQDKRIQIDASILRYKLVLWNVSAQDWIPQQAEEITGKIVNRVAPGNIFLLHDAIYDSQKQGTAKMHDREPMLTGLDNALTELKNKFRFITVSEIIKCGKSVCNWPIKSMA